jgi:hypothetical protein
MNQPARLLSMGLACPVLLLGMVACGGPHATTVDASTSDAVIRTFTVDVGDEQGVTPPGAPNLLFTPDEHVTYQHQPDGTYKLWAAGGGKNGTFGFTSPDLLVLTSMVTTGGTAAGVFLPAGAGTTAFDADYVGADSVFPAANGHDLLMIYHAENHLFSGTDFPGTPFYASIGLARSRDGGLTWQREGQIIAGHDPQQPTQVPTGAGALTPSAIETGGYIYVVFREIDLQTNVSGIALARAPIASDGMPGSWQKYDQGTFGTPGIGGTFTPLAIVLDPARESDRRQPSLSFNSYLGTFVMTIIGNGGVYVATSPDLVTWSAGIVILPAPVPDGGVTPTTAPYNWYADLISPDQPSEATTDQTGFLYYAKGANDGTPHHAMYRRPFIFIGSP